MPICWPCAVGGRRLWREIMAKKKPAVVEKRSKGPYHGGCRRRVFRAGAVVLAGVHRCRERAGSFPVLPECCAAWAAICALSCRWRLSGSACSFAGAARGKRLGVLRTLAERADRAFVLRRPAHVLGGLYQRKRLSRAAPPSATAIFSRSPMTSAWAAARWARCWAALPTCIWASGWAFSPCFCCCWAVLALNGYLGRWVRFVRVRQLEDGRIARQRGGAPPPRGGGRPEF